MIIKKDKIFYSVLTVFIVLALLFSFNQKQEEDSVISKIVDLQKEEICFYWKDNEGKILGNFQNLSSFTKKNNKKLIFAMNGGMYKKDFSPQGLYIENKMEKQKIDTTSGTGNFYLKPNGVFYISKQIASIVKTIEFRN
jgi:uncharacterized protein YigE (DUF2233 family)